MTIIYLIDDYYRRHQQLNVLVDNLNAELPTAEYKCDVCPKDENEAKKHATKSILSGNVWTAVSTAIPGSIFLLDLKLGDLDESQAWESLQEQLSACFADWKDKAQKLLEEWSSSSPHKTAVFACAVLLSRGIDVILISTAAFQDARAIGGSFRIPVAVSSAGEDWPAWKEAILKLRRHDDPTIRKMLVSYFEPIPQSPNAWNHGWCQEDNAITKAQDILGMFCFDEGLPPYSKSKEVKALFRRCDESWKLIHPENIVSSTTLKAALSVLQIKATVDCHVFEFPASPGIAFLIALKELLNASKDKGAPESIRFFALPTDATAKGAARVFGVEIVFPAKDDNPDGLGAVLRLLDKLKRAGADSKGPAGGLAEGIWNLGHCRSNGIRASGQEWAEMFAQGSPYWLAWPSFDKNSVTFHWQNQ